MNLVAVRDATSEDLPHVWALATSIAQIPNWTETMYGTYVDSELDTPCRKKLFVAVANLGVIGFAAGSIVAGQAELESIAVGEFQQRNGVGSLLLAAVTTWARAHSVVSLELEVRAANERAQAFYLAHGFRTEGRRAKYYSKPDDDALLMRLDLAGK